MALAIPSNKLDRRGLSFPCFLLAAAVDVLSAADSSDSIRRSQTTATNERPSTLTFRHR
jgi:hypothetical protein